MSAVNVSLTPADAERAFEEAGLSAREREAARDVIAGATAEESARRLGVSASTVASYRRRACEKLGCEGVRELRERFSPDEPAASVVAPDVLRELGLGETEACVLSLVAAGRSTAQVAEELSVAPGTVSAARAHGYRLLGVHSREELAAALSPEGLERLRERADDLLVDNEPRSPWPRRVYVLVCVLLLAAGLAYEVAFHLVLAARIGRYFEMVWAWLLCVLARPLAALGAAQLVGLAIGRRVRRCAWPWRRVTVACGVVVLAYVLLVTLVVHVLPPAAYVVLESAIVVGAPVILALAVGLALGVSVAVALRQRGRAPTARAPRGWSSRAAAAPGRGATRGRAA